MNVAVSPLRRNLLPQIPREDPRVPQQRLSLSTRGHILTRPETCASVDKHRLHHLPPARSTMGLA